MIDYRCKDCKWYRPLQPSKRGALKGSCKKKSYVPRVDFRYGMTKVCKTYFELKEHTNCDNYEEVDV